MNTLKNISFSNIYNFTCPKTSIGFIVLTNLFLLSIITCHEINTLHFLTQFLWSAFIIIIAYSKFSTIQSDSTQTIPLTLTNGAGCLDCSANCLRWITDERNIPITFIVLLALNVLTNWFSGSFVIFLCKTFTYKYLTIKGIIKQSNCNDSIGQITATVQGIFSKIPRYQRAI